MTYSLNFEMLRNNWSELSDFGAYAEKYLYSDPQSSVLKLRCFVELLIPIIYTNLNLLYDKQWDLFSALTNPEFKDIIDEQILKKFHAIRIKANKVIHNNKISLSDATWLLKESHFIACWFHGIYVKSEIDDRSDSCQFVLPIEADDSKIDVLEQTIKELEKTIEIQKEKNSQTVYSEDERNENVQWFEVINKKVANALNLNDDEINRRITIKDIYADYQLNSGQQELIKKMDDFLKNPNSHAFLLKGYAGTGKTFITKGLTEYFTSIGRKFILAAPTGKAAKVIKEKTKNEAFTIHKSIYSYKDLKEYKVENIDGTETFKFYFDLNDNTHDANTVYIIDESSMIGDINQEGEFFRFGSGKLLSDLMKYIHIDHNDHNKKIIFIGDTAQLPPIGMDYSPALNLEYLEREFSLKCNSFELTEIMRQNSNSGIVENSLAIRESIRQNTFNKLDINIDFEDVQHVEYENLLGQYLDSCDYKINGDSIIIAHSNAVVDEYNKLIRQHFFPNKDFITVGDKVMAVANNGIYPIFIYNGDFGLIKKVDGNIIKREVFVREKINEKLTITTKIPLWFRKVEIGFKNIDDNKSYFFECLIFENILYRDLVYQDTYFQGEINKHQLITKDINRLEMVALYIDFSNRVRERGLKPNTPEFKQEIYKDPYFNSLKIKFGYALTCHKAQGGEWNNVFVNCKTHQNVLTKDYFRWLYTAITRSSKKLYLMNEPHFTPFTKMQQKNEPIPKPAQAPIVNTVVNNELSQAMAPLSLEDSIYSEAKILLDQSNIAIKDITHNQYCEQYTLEFNDEICRVKINYNGKNKITKISAIETNTIAKLAEISLKQLENKTLFVTNSIEKTSQFIFAEDFLEEYYNTILNAVNQHNIDIIQIEHFNYLERYTFKQNNEVSIIDFYYNGKKQFTRSQPQNNSSIELSKLILSLLK